MSSTQLFAFAPLHVWLRLLATNPRLDRQGIPRALAALMTSGATAPLRVYEKLRYRRALAEVEIQPPLFVLGYGRCGTTHLHNLLSRDPRFGAVSTLQALAPGLAIVGGGLLRPLMRATMPAVRPMDNVRVSVDAPQEEEVALANLTHQSVLHHLSFPDRHDEWFRRYALFEGTTPAARRAWQALYREVVAKATLLADGKPLVLKSPTNLGRLPLLLELFPDARFVHIYRNPYDVLPSLLNMYRKLLPGQRLTSVDWARTEALIVEHYRLAFAAYFRDRARIPAGHHAEIQYEALVADPLTELARVYAELDLPDFSAASPTIRDYLRGLASYTRNDFDRDPRLVGIVNGRWGEYVDRWGYPRESA